MILSIDTFDLGSGRDKLLKLLEESAESYAAWESYFNNPLSISDKFKLGEEIADVITVCCNIAEYYDIDIQGMLNYVKSKNKARGRYDE